jgi:hypothetical protein
VRCRTGDGERWTPIYTALNLPLINEFSFDNGWESVSEAIDNYLALAGLPKRTIPIAAERAVAREESLQRQREAQIAEMRAAMARQLAQQAAVGLNRPGFRGGHLV